MRMFTRGAAALVLGTAISASSVGQQPVAPPGAPPAPQFIPPPTGTAPAASLAPTTSTYIEQCPTGTVATVNGKAIQEVEVFRNLREFPQQNWDMARKEILSNLIETALVDQYLTLIKINADPKEVETEINNFKAELAGRKPPKDLYKELEILMFNEAEFREAVVFNIKWEKFVKQQATDAELKKTFESNPDVFDGTMVKASHILLTPGPDPTKQKDADDEPHQANRPSRRPRRQLAALQNRTSGQ